MPKDSKSFLSTLIFCAFLIFLLIIKFGFHELWKDEWQAWLIATDTSWKELIELFPQEGHPSLWFLLLRGVNFIHELLMPGVADVHVLQGLHFLLTAGVYFLLFKKIELPLWMKTGFGFSYFLFFEYGVINRSYILLPLLIFWIIYLLERNKRNYWAISVLLFLLCQVEIYGMIASASLFLFIWLNEFEKKFFELNKEKLITGSALAAGTILFYLTVAPRETDSTATFEQASSLSAESFLKSIQALSINTFYPGIFPTAISDFNFLLMLFGMGLLTAFYFIFKANNNVLIAYAFFVITIWMFSSIIYLGGLRQWGIHLIVFISFLSLIYYKFKKFPIWQKGLILSMIIFLCIHNFRIVGREIKEPFSNSKSAGLFIKDNFTNIPVVGINKPYMTPAIGYAEKRFYSLPYGDAYSYFKWKEKQYIPNMKDLEKFKNSINAEKILIVFNKPLPNQIFVKLQPVAAFNKPSIREEDFYLYVLN